MKADERGVRGRHHRSLVEDGGYRVCKWGTKPEWAGDFDRSCGLDTAELFAFLAETQPRPGSASSRSTAARPAPVQQFAERLAKQIDERGTVDVLRHGVKDHGLEFRLAYFRPPTA